MVLPISTAFSRAPTSKVHRPLLNSIPLVSTPTTDRFGAYNTLYNKFWRQYKQTPELVAVTNIIATDILGDRPVFVDPKTGGPLGRNKFYEAESFWRDQRCKESLKAIVYDLLTTGDGYGWEGKLNNTEQVRIAKELASKLGNKFSWSLKDKSEFIKKAIDEDLKKPKTFDYVASSTMQILSNEYDVIEYVQHANGLTNRFKPDEIIHFRWQTMDGKIEGFSPVESLFKEIFMLWASKANMQAFFENGGSPGKLFTMEDTQPGTDAYERFFEQLTASKDVANRHKNWLGTGKINVQDLDAQIKDMEYKDLMLYITSVIAFSFNIPVSRIPFLLGSSATNGDSGGMAEQGYWNMISERQDMIEDLMNSQLFSKLGFHMKLPRKYKQDSIREAQAANMNQDTVTKLQSIYRQISKRIKVNKLNEMVSGGGFTVTEEDLEDIPQEELMGPMEKTGLMNQNLLDNMSTEKEPDNRKRADTKRNVANDSANKGMGV